MEKLRLKTILLVLFGLVASVFAQAGPTANWLQPAASELLVLDGGRWWCGNPTTGGLDSMFVAQVTSPEGFNMSTFALMLSRDGGAYTNIAGAHTYMTGTNLSVDGPFRLLALEAGHRYTLCIHVQNLAGTAGGGCVTFSTGGSSSPTDVCQPNITWLYPDSATPCLNPAETIRFRVTDPVTPACPASGVGAVSVTLALAGATYYTYTRETGLITEVVDSANIIFALPRTYTIPAGAAGSILVNARDRAGNIRERTITFTACGSSTPADTCPPRVVEWVASGVECIGRDVLQIGGRITDASDACPRSDFNTSTLAITYSVDGSAPTNITSTCTFTPVGSDIRFLWNIPTTIPDGAHITICADIADAAGNVMHACRDYVRCGGTVPADTCCPEIVFRTPARDVHLQFVDRHWRYTVGSGVVGGFHLGIQDMGCPATELNRESFELMYRQCGTTTGTPVTGFTYITAAPGTIPRDSVYGSFDLLTLEAGRCYEICAAISDAAGNRCLQCVRFYTDTTATTPIDTCCPVFETNIIAGTILNFIDGAWRMTTPASGTTAEYIFEIDELGCPATGLNRETFEFTIRRGDGTATPVTGFTYTPTGENHVRLSGTFSSLGLVGGSNYTLCATISDGAGNRCHRCATFSTAYIETTGTDICPPHVAEWIASYLDCIGRDVLQIGARITDTTSTCPPSDFLTSTLAVTASIDGGTPTNVTSACTFTPVGSDIRAMWNIPSTVPFGVHINLCIDVDDAAHNHMHACHEYIRCDTTTTPVDNCPPSATLLAPPLEHCLPADTTGVITFRVFDVRERCVYSGVDSTTIHVTRRVGDAIIDITGECTYTPTMPPLADGFVLNWAYAGFAAGTEVRICVEAADLAGNFINPPICWEWDVCADTTVEDICAPIFTNWVPAAGGIFCPGGSAALGVLIRDPREAAGTLCGTCSGIAYESVVATLTNGGESYTLTAPEGITLTADGTCAVRATINLTDAITLVPDAATLCFTASDLAGNTSDACLEFSICEPHEDICPPHVMAIDPPACLPVERGRLAFLVEDAHDSIECPYFTNINRESIHVFATTGGESREITAECAITAAGTLHPGAFFVIWEYATLAAAGEMEICIEASDLAGNPVRWCSTWTICTTETDACAPILGEWLVRECLPINGAFSVRVVDPLDDVECTYAVGMDTRNYMALMIVDTDTINITTRCRIESSSSPRHMTIVFDGLAELALEPASTVRICILVHDLVGNENLICESFTVCDETPIEDTCPLHLVDSNPHQLSPTSIDVICPLDEPLWMNLADPASDACICTGVDIRSLLVQMYAGGTVYEFTEGAGLIVDLGEFPCHIHVGIDPEYYELTPATFCTLLVHAADLAGHESWWDLSFYTCADTAYRDTCPPIVNIATPADGDTLIMSSGGWATHSGANRVMIIANELGCPATGLANPRAILTACDGTVSDTFFGPAIPPTTLNFTREIVFRELGLTAGNCYNLCFEITDLVGNVGTDCVTFYTARAETGATDICAPTISDWLPRTGDGCLPLYETIGVNVIDVPTILCPSPSGVDAEAVSATLALGDDAPVDITGECTFTVVEGVLQLRWHHTTFFPAREWVELCVRAEDFAGNVVEGCHRWFTCGDSTDTCPPQFTLVAPRTSGCIPARSTATDTTFIRVQMFDMSGSGCFATGIDLETAIFSLCIGADTTDITSSVEVSEIPGTAGRYAVLYNYGELEASTHFAFCASVEDVAGNFTDTCYNFVICPGDTVHDDICLPTISLTYAPEPCLPTIVTGDTGIWFALYDTSGDCRNTGINTRAVRATIVMGTGATIDITPSLRFFEEPATSGVSVLWSWGTLVPSTEFLLCITAEDFAGNSATYCDTFTVCDGDTVEDTSAPCVSYTIPADGATMRLGTVIGASICDLCDGSLAATGVDPSSIHLYVNDVDVTEFSEIAPLYCMGYDITTYDTYAEPGDYFACVEAADFAGNIVEHCWEFTISDATTDTLAVRMIEPLNGTWVNGRNKSVMAYIIGGAASLPDAWTFQIGTLVLTLTSPGVHLRGDTLVFTPLAPWVEGDVPYAIGSAVGVFHVDYTPPTIAMIDMPCGDTLEVPPATLTVRFEDFGSGVNPAACGMQISSPAGTWALRAGHPAVNWDPITNTFTADLSYASFPIYGGINVTIFAGDSPDYTFDGRRDVMPNHSVQSCYFFVNAPVHKYITGTVTNAEGGAVAGAHVIALPYMFAWARMFYPDFRASAVTDEFGRYTVEVGYGRWMLLASVPRGPVMFWENHRYPLDADPIIFGSSSPDTFRADFSMPPAFLARALMSTVDVSGNVTDETGMPLPSGFVVTIATDDDDDELSIATGLIDSLGHFDMRIPSGNYRMVAYAPGYYPTFIGGSRTWDVADSIIVPPAGLSDISLTVDTVITPTGSNIVEGTVFFNDSVTGASTELRGAVVYLLEPSSEEIKYAAISQSDGTFHVDNVFDGFYRLIADRAFYLPQGVWDVVDATDGVTHDIFLTRHTTGITENGKVPAKHALAAHPNPFNAATAVRFTLPSTGEVTLNIVDIDGRTVATLYSGTANAGEYIAVWHPANMSSGVYFAKLSSANGTISTRLLLTK